MKRLSFILLFLFPVLASVRAQAPDFVVTTSDGQVRKLYADFLNKGRVVVLEAFFTSCPPCNAHAPHLQQLYQQMKAEYGNRVEFILLSTLTTDSNTKVAQYLSSKGMTMLAAGADGGSKTALLPYTNGQFGQFQGTPTFIVLQPGTGQVQFDIRGSSPANTMQLIAQQIAAFMPPVCKIRSYLDTLVTDVQLHVRSSSGVTTTVTIPQGTFNGFDLPATFNDTALTLRPFKQEDPRKGLTTYDLTLISRHILGIELLAPWRYPAADLNCSGTITSFDIVIGRKVILGVSDSFLCPGTWRFVPDSITVKAGECADFRAVRLGNLNENYSAPDQLEPFRLSIQDQQLEQGRTYNITCLAHSAAELSAAQFWLKGSEDVLRIESVKSDLQGFEPEDVTGGDMPFLWYGTQPQFVQAGSRLFTLRVTALQSTLLSRALELTGEKAVWLKDGVRLPVELKVENIKKINRKAE